MADGKLNQRITVEFYRVHEPTEEEKKDFVYMGSVRAERRTEVFEGNVIAQLLGPESVRIYDYGNDRVVDLFHVERVETEGLDGNVRTEVKNA